MFLFYIDLSLGTGVGTFPAVQLDTFSGKIIPGYVVFQAPGYGDVRLSLETIPDTVSLEEPFDITCKITNCR